MSEKKSGLANYENVDAEYLEKRTLKKVPVGYCCGRSGLER